MQPNDLVLRGLLLLLTACSFTAPTGADEEPGAATVDAGVGCDESGTVLCLEFDETPAPMVQALDTSGFGHHAAATAVVSADATLVGERPADTRAVFLDETSELRVAASPQLDLQRFTLEAWVVLDTPVPSTFRYWIVDGGEYQMSIGDDQQLRCGLQGGDPKVDSDVAIPADGRWHHVACSFDPAGGGTITALVDGDVSDCEVEAGTVTPLAGDTTIGVRDGGTLVDHFRGPLDNVRIYPEALAPSEICRLAGRTGCRATCPTGDDND